MTNNELNQYFEERLKNCFEKKFLAAPRKLKEACTHILFGGGKRIRPKLCFSSANFLGINEEEVIDFAIAIEFIHTYSLIHDDMPCMDNDDYRRGRPTVHKMYGEAIALLAGDALLNAAYELLLSDSDPKYRDGIKLIADCAGVNGMIGGQTGEFITNEFDAGTYTDICLKKTGALISASIMAPATLSYDEDKKTALASFARSFGLCFQAADDLRDKEKGEKASFVAIIGEIATKDLIERTCASAIRAIENFDESDDLIDFCMEITDEFCL